MNILRYLLKANKDYRKECEIFVKRNSKYASDDDIYENTKKMVEIARILDIDVRNFADVEWFYLIGKLVRQRRCPQDENYHDAKNYLTRAHYAKRKE